MARRGPPVLTSAEAEDAIYGSLHFGGMKPKDALDFAERKRAQGLTVRVSARGGRFDGDHFGTTKVTFWTPTPRS